MTGNKLLRSITDKAETRTLEISLTNEDFNLKIIENIRKAGKAANIQYNLTKSNGDYNKLVLWMRKLYVFEDRDNYIRHMKQVYDDNHTNEVQ